MTRDKVLTWVFLGFLAVLFVGAVTAFGLAIYIALHHITISIH